MNRKAKEVYERYRHRGNLIERAVRILDARGEKNNRGKAYSIKSLWGYIYSPDKTVAKFDQAIIEAAIEYEEERKQEAKFTESLAAQLEGVED